jgi:hypothetical protein
MIFNLKTENFCCLVIVIGVFLFLWQIDYPCYISPPKFTGCSSNPNVMVLGWSLLELN